MKQLELSHTSGRIAATTLENNLAVELKLNACHLKNK